VQLPSSVQAAVLPPEPEVARAVLPRSSARRRVARRQVAQQQQLSAQAKAPVWVPERARLLLREPVQATVRR
jgi:hypothetical protein